MIYTPTPEEEDYLDEVESLPKRVLMYLGIFVLSCFAIGSIYWLIGFWKMFIGSLILLSVAYLVYVIRKGILTARKNNKNGNIHKTSLQKTKQRD